MKIAIIGVGGVGGVIGAAFCQSDHEVTFVARGAHAEKISKKGLHIIEDEHEYDVYPDSVSSLEDLDGIFDFILLSVKSYDIEKSVDVLAKNIDAHTIIMPISNGVNHADEVKSLCEAKVLDACVYILAHIERAGVIRKKGKVFAAIFGSDEDKKSVQKIDELFNQAHLRHKTPDDIKSALWKKYIFISAFATLSSYYDKSIYALVDEHLDEVKTLLNEIVAVAASVGVNIEEEVEKSISVARSLPKDASTSMHKDFSAHRRTELETLSGYIVYEAKVKAIEVPLMSKLYEALKIKEQSYAK